MSGHRTISDSVRLEMTSGDAELLLCLGICQRFPILGFMRRGSRSRVENWCVPLRAKSIICFIRLGPAFLKSAKPVFFPVMYHFEAPTARISSVLTKREGTAGKCFTDGGALGISLKRGPPMQMAHYFNIWIFILLKHLFFSLGFI